jgi:hypothetical protein
VSIELVIALHLAATLFMTGVIWFVQVVHYPLFALVAPEAYPTYERQHQRLTTFVVAPAMLIELFSGAWIAYSIPAYRNDPLFGIAGALLIVIWLSTVFLQVPCHQRLAEKFTPEIHRRLVLSNWARTIAWTFRSAAVVLLIFYL